MPDERNEDRPNTSPYGPQHGHVDQAAGGADSSPFEDVPSGEQKEAAKKDERLGNRPKAQRPAVK